MNTDFDRSLKRLVDGEDYRTRTAGFGTTKQGLALAREYRAQLADRIGADRAHGCDKVVWRALRGVVDETLADRLLIAGISVAEGGDLGTDEDGEKNFRDMALWIGRNLGHRRELGLKVGTWGINMLLTLPAFALDGDVLRMTASVDDLMDQVIERGVENNPLLSPLTSPPEDWTQVRKGGLPVDHWARVSLIREHHPSIERAARKAIGKRGMQRVLDAINALQRVPFSINEPILEFILRAGPSPDQLQVFDIDTVTAEVMACAERFWVPLNIDFRGRVYGIPHFNFAREDHVRALFLFADGERIGEDGLLQLKAYVAATASGNDWSPEKKPGELTLINRVAWTDRNLETLRSIGEAVLRGDDPAKLAWALPSDPYQFLAACVELVQALDVGPDFKTRLPLMFDASCSGLQHLCAMTRADEGRYVNLVASDDADDFYKRVAFRAHQAAPDLMRGPFDREIVKQPAMSYFYGSRAGGFARPQKGDWKGRWRPYGMTKQIIQVLEERKQPTSGAKKLAHVIYDNIEDMVPRAKAVRDFLEQLAILCSDENKPLRWTTPLGLPIINCYYKPEKKRIPVLLNGRRRRVNFIVGDKNDIDKDKATNSATANFVHSVDAAHLQLVVLAAAKERIDMVSIHDCFGCLAPHASRLNEIIREQFVHLHKRHSVLARVWSSARHDLPRRTELPTPPEPGNLEIDEVLSSFHAFR
jgi:DNA-directed RNA polymerase, mitochondrial